MFNQNIRDIEEKINDFKNKKHKLEIIYNKIIKKAEVESQIDFRQF